VGFGGFIVLGGLRLFKRGGGITVPIDPEAGTMEAKHWLTLCGIAGLIIGVVGFGLDVGMTALGIAAVLTLLRTVDENRAIRGMPWSVIIMVTGVTVLVSILQKTQGLELITSGLANISTSATVAPIVAFGSGVVSVYSSTSGVVLPAFLPMVPGIARDLGGIEQLPVAWSINIGASLVDLSSLSTVGALFMAAVPAGADARRLFNALLIWGLSMSVVGAAICWLLFGRG
jgi:di/tricarboxylate transporter